MLSRDFQGHMKKTLASLLLFSAALSVSACHKHCQKPPEDAPATRTAVLQTPDAGTAVPESDAQVVTMAQETDGGVTSTATAPVPDAAARASKEACVDTWLKNHAFDAYGNKAGTMYMGGTPLFDERTGERQDRLAFVFKKRPEAATACGGK